MAVQLFLMVSPAAMAQGDMPAVLSADGICTRDYNPCGNASICVCPDGYEYDSSVGLCLIEDINNATSRGLDSISVKSSCSIQVQPLPATCTRDTNALGYPSKCLCPGISEYNQLFGQCVIPLG
ncbi:hypothetical protein LYNGBM3L_71650 [Moorena producens 3L]|uniref:Uncharacterized protein n=1 Tax=Moorena producens 3L TaxID=489825 RepID=F4Y368_9CYAN|nr:hypothetical protein LYNGBM3L_71650 [Moorena producens 3L]